MATIIPRWEWRTFGASFGAAEPLLAALEPTAVQESDETYVLADAGATGASDGPRATIKIRFGLLDIKELVEVDDDGLEQWRPTLKAEFPMAAADVTRLFAALGRPAPSPARPEYTVEEFLAEVATAANGLRAVAVHKRRVRHEINGCTAEVTDVTADGLPIRTVAIESPDAAAVVEGVRQVGLAGYRNTAYGPGLGRLLDGTPPRYAVIDVGTNSVKFHVGERASDGSWTRVRDRAELTRLGEGLGERGTISAEATARTADAIAGMVTEAVEDDALAIAAVGTAGLRIATNRDEVLEAIRRRAGIRVEVVSGEEESRLAFLAAKAGVGLGGGTVAVFDTGGGSTQLTFGHGDRVDERFSVDVGAVRYTERFGLAGAVDEAVLDEALAAISADLARLDGRPPIDALVGMGGVLTNLAAVSHAMAHYDPDRIQGTVLDRAEVTRQVEAYRERDAAGRRTITGLQPGRADVILAGACIVRTIMDKLGCDTLTVSDRGLRHGLLAERFGA